MTINDKSKFEAIEWIIFDADGVITSESDYWLAGELVILEVLFGDEFLGFHNEALRTILHKPGAAVVPDRFITHDFISLIKNAGIGNNWDATYISLSLYLTDLLSKPQSAGMHDRFNNEGPTPSALHEMGRVLSRKYRDVPHIDELARPFFEFVDKFRADETVEKDADSGAKARKIEQALNAWLREKPGIENTIFKRKGDFWHFCKNLFQNYFLGDDLCAVEGYPKVSILPKDGLIHYELPLMPLPQIVDTLTLLHEARIRLGIGTGRPYIELMAPLSRWGIGHLFEPHSVATHQEIDSAQEHFAGSGKPMSLSKPHPFVFLRAMFPEKSDEEIVSMELPISNPEKYLIVGDAPVDLIAARSIGCRSAAVLSTARITQSLEMAAALSKLEPDFVLMDITELKDLF